MLIPQLSFSAPALPLGSVLFDEIGLLIVVLITLIGVWLRLYLPRHRMEVEEHVKNNKVTEAEARRQIKSLEKFSTAVTFIGLGLLFLLLWDMIY